ncbi:MAG: Panacea domain-containing protein [Alphaproteobacteria bacterium]|nr:Panacea domain-containing protein [Alphaproteobacteria bacterium]
MTTSIFATALRVLWRHPLKSKRADLKIVFSYYGCVYERIGKRRSIAARETPMPLKFRPKLDKIVELLLYLAKRRPGADKYQAVKFLYLTDREHFQRYGRPITFDDYYAMWYGPVASNALDLLHEDYWTLRRAGINSLPFKTERGYVKFKSGKDTETVFIRAPLRAVNDSIFSKSDIEVFDEIIEKYGDASFDELFEMTHKHPAYLNAWNNKPEGQKRAPMAYDDMIEDEVRRKSLVADLAAVSAKM